MTVVCDSAEIAMLDASEFERAAARLMQGLAGATVEDCRWRELRCSGRQWQVRVWPGDGSAAEGGDFCEGGFSVSILIRLRQCGHHRGLDVLLVLPFVTQVDDQRFTE